ncbi:MAG TPA: hypothetical protein VNT60_00760 [Deinococcales bacterium]|nr:hypothetical protein [Deinococcales bacterium]
MLRTVLQIVALLVTAFPWAAAGLPGRAKAEAGLSSPHQGVPAIQATAPDAAGGSAAGAPASLSLQRDLDYGEVIAAPDAPRPERRLAGRAWLLYARLQLDGG